VVLPYPFASMNFVHHTHRQQHHHSHLLCVLECG